MKHLQDLIRYGYLISSNLHTEIQSTTQQTCSPHQLEPIFVNGSQKNFNSKLACNAV
jgi:hypothetical protein